MDIIDKYLNAVKPEQKTELERIRKIIKKTVPNAAEAISYGMPAFRFNGKYLIAYAPFKNHMSIFPGASAIETLKPELKAFKTSKGTIQFTKDNPVTEDLLKQIIQVRLEEINKI